MGGGRKVNASPERSEMYHSHAHQSRRLWYRLKASEITHPIIEQHS